VRQRVGGPLEIPQEECGSPLIEVAVTVGALHTCHQITTDRSGSRSRQREPTPRRPPADAVRDRPLLVRDCPVRFGRRLRARGGELSAIALRSCVGGGSGRLARPRRLGGALPLPVGVLLVVLLFDVHRPDVVAGARMFSTVSMAYTSSGPGCCTCASRCGDRVHVGHLGVEVLADHVHVGAVLEVVVRIGLGTRTT